ncbi:restriction endonuclease subunit S [Mycobacterium sp. shizuoka-1]|uniref:restriction endonuclease subunit S n=1 Tax=Mycobacterium sp. shizuoka-1 TaxID=2039281 RepID=UPI000C05E2FD|nr:restriction endonuclease subunit S [Mycobacterium sp. shizuoka-1]GAY18746.1 hypothetical protein MSZK_54720 [Mycobacterium sp. shizuoka-1]
MKHASVLPDEWTTLRLKHLLAEPLKYGANEAALSDEPDDPRFVRITDIADDGTLKPDTFRSLPPEVAQPYLLKDGDLLFARSGATVGKSIMYSEAWGPCCFAGYLIRARPDAAKALPEYIRYFCESRLYWQYITSEQIQATIQNVSAERYGNLPLPIPSVVWQRKIVEFLDRQTAKIDALIVKQEHLIATLREDRTATITHAVTKGIDADVEMEESGVEWLGEIPRHWTHSFVKYAATLLSGYPFKSEGFTHDSDDLRLLRGANVGVNEIDWTDVVRWPSDEATALAAYELQKGDIVMGLDRPFISTGIRVSRIGPEDLPSLLLQRVARLRAVANFEQDYLFHLLTGPGILHHLTPMFTGVSVPHVSPDQVGSFPIPQPPLAEQRRIVSYLTDRCGQIDRLINKASASIDVLREYRSALITDAVTGKIDVRGVA